MGTTVPAEPITDHHLSLHHISLHKASQLQASQSIAAEQVDKGQTDQQVDQDQPVAAELRFWVLDVVGAFGRASEEAIGPFGDRATSYHEFVVLLLAQTAHLVSVEHQRRAVPAGNAQQLIVAVVCGLAALVLGYLHCCQFALVLLGDIGGLLEDEVSYDQLAASLRAENK